MESQRKNVYVFKVADNVRQEDSCSMRTASFLSYKYVSTETYDVVKDIHVDRLFIIDVVSASDTWHRNK